VKLLRRIFYDEMGGRPERRSHERFLENKMVEVDIRPTHVKDWEIKVSQGEKLFREEEWDMLYFWPEH
jgi:hypothetical protein